MVRVDVCAASPAPLPPGAALPRHHWGAARDARGRPALPRVPEVLPLPGVLRTGRDVKARHVDTRVKWQSAGEPDGQPQTGLAARPE